MRVGLLPRLRVVELEDLDVVRWNLAEVDLCVCVAVRVVVDDPLRGLLARPEVHEGVGVTEVLRVLVKHEAAVPRQAPLLRLAVDDVEAGILGANVGARPGVGDPDVAGGEVGIQVCLRGPEVAAQVLLGHEEVSGLVELFVAHLPGVGDAVDVTPDDEVLKRTVPPGDLSLVALVVEERPRLHSALGLDLVRPVERRGEAPVGRDEVLLPVDLSALHELGLEIREVREQRRVPGLDGVDVDPVAEVIDARMDEVGLVARAHLAERVVVRSKEAELRLAVLVDVRPQNAVLATVRRILVAGPLEDVEVARLLLDRRTLLRWLRSLRGRLRRALGAAGREHTRADGRRSELEEIASPELPFEDLTVVLLLAHTSTSWGRQNLTDASVNRY